MTKIKYTNWTPKIIAEIALKHSSRSEFSDLYFGAYKAAKRFGILEEVCAHMPAPQRIIKKTEIKAAALKYKTRKEFREKELNMYSAMHRRGLTEELCAHMRRERANWTKKAAQKIARRYDDLFEFRRSDFVAYRAAERRGWLEEITSHMVEGEPSNKASANDAVYIWELKEHPGCYKIGATSKRIGKTRIKLCSKRNGLTPRVIGIWGVKDARETESMLHSLFDNNPDLGLVDGNTEVRKLDQEELAQCVAICASS